MGNPIITYHIFTLHQHTPSGGTAYRTPADLLGFTAAETLSDRRSNATFQSHAASYESDKRLVDVWDGYDVVPSGSCYGDLSTLFSNDIEPPKDVHGLKRC